MDEQGELDGTEIPITAFGSERAFICATFGSPDLMKLYLEENRGQIAAVFNTFRIRDGKKQTSMNDIVGRAKKIAVILVRGSRPRRAGQ
jgi:hypothetical protein